MKMRYIMGCFMALLFSVPAVAQQYKIGRAHV